MTAPIPTTAWPVQLAPASAAITKTLDRLAWLALCAFVFAVPWGEGVFSFGPLLLVNWLGLTAFAAVALRTMITGRVRKPSALHYWMVGLVAWSMLSIFWTVDWDITAQRAGTYLQLLIAVWLIWELALTETRVLGLLQAYVFGALVSSGSAIYNFMNGRTTAQLAAEAGKSEWETFRYSISGVNANDLGLILALSIPMIFYLLASRKGSLVKMLCWLQLVTAFTAIFLTASRGALLASTAALVMLPLSLSRLSRWHRVLSLFACAGVLAVGLYVIPPSSWARIFRFEEEFAGGTLTHRTVLWSAGLEVFRDHAFLGIGSGAYGRAISSVADSAYTTGNAAAAVAHNTFISVLVELGVVGALLVLGLLCGIFYYAFRMPYLQQRLWITLMLTWAVGVSALTWEYRKTTWLLFALVAAHAFCRRTDALFPRLKDPVVLGRPATRRAQERL